jgi:type I restriction enzyme M protein
VRHRVYRNFDAILIASCVNQCHARPLTVEDFADFEAAYGTDPNGGAKREDQGEEGRCRCFMRDAIKARNDNLDIAWLRSTEEEALNC